MDNGNIVVVGRGKPKSVAQQITGLIIEFTVSKDPVSGAYTLTPVREKDPKRVFPSIFCRQLDHIKQIKNKIVLVQDTADGDNFDPPTCL